LCLLAHHLESGHATQFTSWLRTHGPNTDTRLESIQILLAYVTYHGFKLYQMDVKSAFLSGPIKEEVYVKQPPSFEDSEYA
jgi:hypothetical protein